MPGSRQGAARRLGHPGAKLNATKGPVCSILHTAAGRPRSAALTGSRPAPSPPPFPAASSRGIPPSAPGARLPAWTLNRIECESIARLQPRGKGNDDGLLPAAPCSGCWSAQAGGATSMQSYCNSHIEYPARHRGAIPPRQNHPTRYLRGGYRRFVAPAPRASRSLIQQSRW